MLATLAIDLQGPWNESISTQVVTLLFSIITVPACRTAFLESSGHEAQTLLDVFQKVCFLSFGITAISDRDSVS
jgi:hypothetical protein